MTVTAGGLGYSRQATPYKQFALDNALGHLLGSSVSVARKEGAPCIVCDMTAGPGTDPQGQDGSPLIIAKHMEVFRAKGADVRLVCVDKNAEHLRQLEPLLHERYPELAVEYFRAQSAALATIPTGAVGLTYWDPTRYNDLDHDLLSHFGRSHRRMDILITRECLAGYRMMRATHCPGTLAMQDYLALTGKKRNYVLEYTKYHWWALGFADNWETRPIGKMRGFVEVGSKEGQQLCNKWVGTKPDAHVESDDRPEEQPLW